MNDVEFTLKLMGEMITAAREAADLPARAGLYAAARRLSDDVRAHVDEHKGGSGNLRMLLTEYDWHIGAALGFAVTNDKPADQHRGWALGALQSLEGHLTRG
jgi:hypothetical protein